jgi:hypothetical protein
MNQHLFSMRRGRIRERGRGRDRERVDERDRERQREWMRERERQREGCGLKKLTRSLCQFFEPSAS